MEQAGDCAFWITFRAVGSAILILFLIGAIAGTWMVSGIVPALICYGLKIIYPAVFLAAACVICALVSVMTGSSWTTIATIGVALIGIGIAQGFDPGWTAGAIVSGAYFGDKISPLSDTTVLASSASGTPLFYAYPLYDDYHGSFAGCYAGCLSGGKPDASAGRSVAGR